MRVGLYSHVLGLHPKIIIKSIENVLFGNVSTDIVDTTAELTRAQATNEVRELNLSINFKPITLMSRTQVSE